MRVVTVTVAVAVAVTIDAAVPTRRLRDKCFHLAGRSSIVSGTTQSVRRALGWSELEVMARVMSAPLSPSRMARCRPVQHECFSVAGWLHATTPGRNPSSPLACAHPWRYLRRGFQCPSPTSLCTSPTPSRALGRRAARSGSWVDANASQLPPPTPRARHAAPPLHSLWPHSRGVSGCR